jgi:hypothetical protein
MPIERLEPKAAPVDPHQSWREDLADVLDASKESLLGVVQQKLADEGKVRVSRGVRSPRYRYRPPARLVSFADVGPSIIHSPAPSSFRPDRRHRTAPEASPRASSSCARTRLG